MIFLCHKNGSAVKVDAGIGLLVMWLPRKYPVLKGQNGLGQPQAACRSIKMTIITLDRTDGRLIGLCLFSGKGPGQTVNFNRIPQDGSSAVRFKKIQA